MSEEVDYKIIGETAQVLEINLEPDATFIADAGALLYLDEEVVFETKSDDGSSEEDIEKEDNLDLINEDLLDEDDEIDFKALDEDDEKDSGILEKLVVAGGKWLGNLGKKKKDEEKEDDPIIDDSEDEGFSLESNFSDEPEPYNWFITHFTNESDYIRKIAFTASNSGIVLPIDTSALEDGELIIQTGKFLCARKGIQIEQFMDTGISISFVKEKFFNLDKVSGQSTVFLQAEGQVIEKELENDAIRINLFSLIAFEATLDLDLGSIQKVASMHYEEDTVFVQLVGSGKFWLQSANLQHLVYKISPFIFEPSSRGVEEDVIPSFTPEATSSSSEEDEIDIDSLDLDIK